MKRVALALILLLAGLLGCNRAAAYTPDDSKDWLYPGKVSIGNFKPGDIADGADNPDMVIKIHMGDNLVSKQWRVTTEPNETVVVLPPLAQRIYGNVKNIRKLESDLASDSLKVFEYNSATGELTVSGFTPDATRVITLEYPAQSVMRLYYRLADNELPGYSPAPVDARAWVLLDGQSTDNFAFTMSPGETREVKVMLAMPKTAKAPKKWEFWITAIKQTGAQIEVELATRFLVNMK